MTSIGMESDGVVLFSVEVHQISFSRFLETQIIQLLTRITGCSQNSLDRWEGVLSSGYD